MIRWTVVLLAAALAGCATPGGPPATGEGQAQREQRILARDDWALKGRIAVSDGRDGGSARINWNADPDQYELWIYAPLAQGTWRLTGGDGQAELTGPQGSHRGADAQTLVAEHLGWHLPVTGLLHWVRGLRAPGAVTSATFDDRGRLAELQQGGWTVTYTDWKEYPGLAMPRRIEAEYPPYQVKLVVQDWALKRRQAPGEP